jgi:Tannase and feruloyl esterase
MIGSIALMLLSAASSPAACESLASLKLDQATITSAQMVPEGPAPARGGRAGASPAQPAALIPAHCRVQMVLKPTADSLINMELWLPAADKWNGKFMGVGNGGFAGSIQGLTNEMPQALRLGYATAGTDTGHQDQGGAWAIGHPEKMIDFGYRATHEMTLKSKAIVKAFYDRSAQ